VLEQHTRTHTVSSPPDDEDEAVELSTLFGSTLGLGPCSSLALEPSRTLYRPIVEDMTCANILPMSRRVYSTERFGHGLPRSITVGCLRSSRVAFLDKITLGVPNRERMRRRREALYDRPRRKRLAEAKQKAKAGTGS
jgi:hypothetical protein